MNVSDIFLMLLGVNPGPQPGFCCCNTLSGMQVTINAWCLMLSLSPSFICQWQLLFSGFLRGSSQIGSNTYFCSKIYFPENILSLWNLSQ